VSSSQGDLGVGGLAINCFGASGVARHYDIPPQTGFQSKSNTCNSQRFTNLMVTSQPPACDASLQIIFSPHTECGSSSQIYLKNTKRSSADPLLRPKLDHHNLQTAPSKHTPAPHLGITRLGSPASPRKVPVDAVACRAFRDPRGATAPKS